MSEEASVIPMMNVLAQRIRAALELTDHGRQEWIDGTLELASSLAEARRRFKSDNQFAHWIVDEDLEGIGANDRSALIKMAGDLHLARQILEESGRHSWQLIWREEMAGRFTNASKPDAKSHNRDSQLSQAEIPAKPQDITAADAPRHPSPLPHRSAFRGFDRGAEVHGIYRHQDCRTFIARSLKQSGGKQIWQMILTALDAGLLAPTNMVLSRLSLRLLFPDAPFGFCLRYDLTDSKQRKHVRDILLPAAISNKDAILHDPNRIEEILADHHRQQQTQEAQGRRDRDLAQAIASLPSHEDQVIIFGKSLWPCTDPSLRDSFSYDQLRAACWAFKDMRSWMQMTPDHSPRSMAIRIRLSTRWYAEFADRSLSAEVRSAIKRVYQLVHLMAGLLETNPEGECRWPASPTSEGQWP